MKEYPKNKNYIVYEDGRIYSKRFNKFLIPKRNWDGYLRIQIWDNGKASMIAWHRIIAETFIPNLENKPVVNHKDGNKQNNCAANLEWVTQQENIIHAWRTGLSKSQLNNKHTSKSVNQYSLSGEFIKTFLSQMEVERELNINHAIISHCCRGKRKSVGGYIWKFNETSND